jgi:hypothetical protein
MINFNLICASGHTFEGWFGSSADYDDQQARGLVSCPICGIVAVSKALMTPNVTAKSNKAVSSPPTLTPPEPESERVVMPPASTSPAPEITSGITPEIMPEITPEKMTAIRRAMTKMRKIQTAIEGECDNVGDEFAEEARKIHYGEVKPRGIYGKASDDEAAELVDEGIAITKMPWLPKEQ